MSIFYDRLTQLRKEKKITKADILKHISDNYDIYGSEDYQIDFTAVQIIAAADLLNVSTDYLLGRTDNPEINK